jgi:hypothetical protein
MLSPNFVARYVCCAALLMTSALPGVARAADDEKVAQLEARLDESLKSIEQLTARVRELEARMNAAQPGAPAAAPPATTPPASPAEERLATVEREVAGITAANASRHDDLGLPLHGFADVGAGTRSTNNPNVHGAAVGSVDFYLTPELGERTRSLFELNFKMGTNGALVTALERAQLGYQIADAGTLWLGRFHTPYGYYNTAFHHGQQISTSLRRPKLVEFEASGGVLPAHTVGLWFAGSNRMDAGRLTYDLYAGNAQRIAAGVIDTNNIGNPHGDAIYGANLGFLPEALDGFKAGVSAFTAKIEDDQLVRNLTRVTNYSAYLVYDTDRWENMAEYYRFDNDDLSGATGSHESEMGYIQLAYRMGSWIPYGRYERADYDQTDHYFAAQTSGFSYYRTALGLRFDLDLASALKLELAQTHVTDRAIDEYDEALIQYAIRF